MSELKVGNESKVEEVNKNRVIQKFRIGVEKHKGKITLLITLIIMAALICSGFGVIPGLASTGVGLHLSAAAFTVKGVAISCGMLYATLAASGIFLIYNWEKYLSEKSNPKEIKELFVDQQIVQKRVNFKQKKIAAYSNKLIEIYQSLQKDSEEKKLKKEDGRIGLYGFLKFIFCNSSHVADVLIDGFIKHDEKSNLSEENKDSSIINNYIDKLMFCNDDIFYIKKTLLKKFLKVTIDEMISEIDKGYPFIESKKCEAKEEKGKYNNKNTNNQHYNYNKTLPKDKSKNEDCNIKEKHVELIERSLKEAIAFNSLNLLLDNITSSLRDEQYTKGKFIKDFGKFFVGFQYLLYQFGLHDMKPKDTPLYNSDKRVSERNIIFIKNNVKTDLKKSNSNNDKTKINIIDSLLGIDEENKNNNQHDDNFSNKMKTLMQEILREEHGTKNVVIEKLNKFFDENPKVSVNLK